MGACSSARERVCPGFDGPARLKPADDLVVESHYKVGEGRAEDDGGGQEDAALIGAGGGAESHLDEFEEDLEQEAGGEERQAEADAEAAAARRPPPAPEEAVEVSRREPADWKGEYDEDADSDGGGGGGGADDAADAVASSSPADDAGFDSMVAKMEAELNDLEDHEDGAADEDAAKADTHASQLDRLAHELDELMEDEAAPLPAVYDPAAPEKGEIETAAEVAAREREAQEAAEREAREEAERKAREEAEDAERKARAEREAREEAERKAREEREAAEAEARADAERKAREAEAEAAKARAAAEAEAAARAEEEEDEAERQKWEDHLANLERAAEGGALSAQQELARLYAHGGGNGRHARVVRSWTKAMHYWAQAGEAGDADAHLQMALVFRRGEPPSVPQSMRDAYGSFLSAAQHGSAAGGWEAARMLLRGEGVERDPAAAFRWFLHAAENGHVESMCDAGRALRQGLGTEQNFAEAWRWLRASAAGGSAAALFELAGMLEAAEGCEANAPVAHACLELARDRDPAAVTDTALESRIGTALAGNVLQASFAHFLAYLAVKAERLAREAESRRKVAAEAAAAKAAAAASAGPNARLAASSSPAAAAAAAADLGSESDVDSDVSDIDNVSDSEGEEEEAAAAASGEAADTWGAYGEPNSWGERPAPSQFSVDRLFDSQGEKRTVTFDVLSEQWHQHLLDAPLEDENREALRELGINFGEDGLLLDD